MKTALEQFYWAVPNDGYAWETAEAARFIPGEPRDPDEKQDIEETRFLRCKSEDALAKPIYPLIDHPTLFRTFANLEPTEEAFARFANQYGWLGVSVFLISHQDEAQKVVQFNHRGQGEPLWRWKREHHQMRTVMPFLTAIQNRDTAFLKKWIHILPDAVNFECTDPALGLRFGSICSRQQLRDWLWQWGMRGRTEDERIVRFASGWAQEHINKAMSSGRSEHSMTSVRILLNHEADAMRLHIVPDTLLAAMWLQCARVLTLNPTFRACERCGTWFELSADKKRKHTKYCSDRCKVSAYRNRKAAIIPMACPLCGEKMIVECEATKGFGHMNFQPVECPRCHKTTDKQVPSIILAIRSADSDVS
jgi:hypothetical protein